jgi:aryl-alcohol dehydrogenase-like predicted oxidoreductase
MTLSLSRRRFLTRSAAVVAGSLAAPHFCLGDLGVDKPMTRVLGRTGFEVTTLGLGGQASLQWTPADVDPLPIILKALDRGVNYFDTSNAYGPSQMNFGKAMRARHLVPGRPGYDEPGRRAICLASKTMIRHAKGSHPDVHDRTDGPPGSRAADDIKRSLSQLFGDGRGAYPAGAYLDLFFIHNLNTVAEVDAIYEGLDRPDPQAERLGALAVLRDYRDGSNLTGLNPNEEKLIRRIGISGHWSSPVMMECLQRDRSNLIDGMLIAINANDRRYLSHQYNAIPVAAARNVGIVAMKVFSDGAMYTKEPRWSQTPADVVRTVGDARLPSRPLVEYALATPGIDTLIIGIGQIDADQRRCQLDQNLSAAQIRPNALSDSDRQAIERLAEAAGKGRTNWFQVARQPLGAPREATATLQIRDQRRSVQLAWQTAYAGDQPIRHYEIRRNGQAIATVEHQPQTTKTPFSFEDPLSSEATPGYVIAAVDAAGQTAATEPMSPAMPL